MHFSNRYLILKYTTDPWNVLKIPRSAFIIMKIEHIKLNYVYDGTTLGYNLNSAHKMHTKW